MPVVVLNTSKPRFNPWALHIHINLLYFMSSRSLNLWLCRTVLAILVLDVLCWVELMLEPQNRPTSPGFPCLSQWCWLPYSCSVFHEDHCRVAFLPLPSTCLALRFICAQLCTHATENGMKAAQIMGYLHSRQKKVVHYIWKMYKWDGSPRFLIPVHHNSLVHWFREPVNFGVHIG